MKAHTRLVQSTHWNSSDDPHGATSPPLYQTATFAQPGPEENGRFDYSRSGNPTRELLEQALVELENGARGLAYSSGMAALSAITQLVQPGQHVIAGSDLYGGTYRLLQRVLKAQGVGVSFVDTSDLQALEAAFCDSTQLCLLETPTNPLQQIVDVRAVAELCRARGVLLAVDNTMLSPWGQKPLELGADLVVHSATKHLGGHGDLTAGAIVTASKELGERLGFLQNAQGNALGPFDAWLLMRGLKTLGVRLERQQQTTQQVAEFLEAQPGVARVHYVGLASHPGRDLHLQQATGCGSVVSFETGCRQRSNRLLKSLGLFRIAVSFGCVSSQASLPLAMSHAPLKQENTEDADADSQAKKPGFAADLVRLSIGLEAPEDLIVDLRQGLVANEELAEQAATLEAPGPRTQAALAASSSGAGQPASPGSAWNSHKTRKQK